MDTVFINSIEVLFYLLNIKFKKVKRNKLYTLAKNSDDRTDEI